MPDSPAGGPYLPQDTPTAPASAHSAVPAGLGVPSTRDAARDRSLTPAIDAPASGSPPDNDAVPADPGSRLHPAWIAIGAVRRFRGFLVPLVVLVVTRDGGEAGTLGLVLLATLATLGWQAAEWATTRWAVDGGRLRLTSGLLGRRERFVPLERVQAVDLSDTPLERLFGVAGVRVETAAGGAGGIVLEAVGRREAEALRSRLLAARGANAPGSSPAPAIGPNGEGSTIPAAFGAGDAALLQPAPVAPPLYRMGWREVLLAGATSGRIGPALAVLGFAVGAIDDLAELPMVDRLLAWMPLPATRGIGAVAAVFVAGAVVAWLLAIAGAALTWSGFEVRREGDRILLAHGLLDRRRRSLPLAKMQAIAVRESPLRRPFGLAEVRFESAGRGADDADSGILLPLVRTGDVPALMAALAPALAPPAALPVLDRPPARARSRFIGGALRGVVGLVALAVAAAALLPGIAWWWGLVLLVGVPLALMHGELAWRDAGWAIDGDRLLLRTGGLERRLTLAPRRRLQRRGTTQTPFARRADLATFRADVPAGGGGGHLRLPHLDAADAARLVAALRG